MLNDEVNIMCFKMNTRMYNKLMCVHAGFLSFLFVFRNILFSLLHERVIFEMYRVASVECVNVTKNNRRREEKKVHMNHTIVSFCMNIFD